jgi:hypothetical protein
MYFQICMYVSRVPTAWSKLTPLPSASRVKLCPSNRPLFSSETTLMSPYSSILDTNYVPSQAERREICRYILNEERKLTIIHAKPSQIIEHLDVLLRERKECCRNLERHKMLLSPARRMPAEILSSIFLECLPVGKLDSFQPSAHKAPLLVSSICSRWRNVAISTPQLWSSVYLCFDDMAYLTHRGQMMTRMLKRLKYVRRHRNFYCLVTDILPRVQSLFLGGRDLTGR